MARVRCFKDKLCPYIAARRGLSRKEKKDKKEIDLCRPPRRSFMWPKTTFVAEHYWFSKPVSFNVECKCRVETARWKFLSPQLSRKPVL